MKKKLITLMLTALMTLVIAMPVMAEHYFGGEGWAVLFTSQKKMESNFTSSSMTDTLTNLQPGDDATFTVTVNNQYPGLTHWYMSNKVIQSLEDASKNSQTAGGAYTYRLTYRSASGATKVLFSSDDVGGEMTDEEIQNAGEGLHEATNALEDYFFLDDLNQSGAGVITLFVGLDGETQNNNYQDTLASLQLNFAVEVEDELLTPPPPRVPDTGDTNNMLIYFILIGVAGVLMLVVAIRRVMAGRNREEK